MANVTYLPIDGEHVSRMHLTWMLAARADGITFRVNEGHRTMARQWQLFRQNMHMIGGRWVPKPDHALTAFPSPFAPHIRTGNPNHDNDIDQFFGDGIDAVIRWLKRHGAHPTLCVHGEGWHLCITNADLRMLYDKFKHDTLHVGSRGERVQTAQVMMRAIGRWPHDPGKTFGRRFKRAVIGYQHSQGIKADGIIGPGTLKHLRADYERKKRKR